MTTAELQRGLEKLAKSGVTMAEAIERMAESFRRLERASKTMAEWLGLRPRRIPKQVLVVTMDDGVTRRVVYW